MEHRANDFSDEREWRVFLCRTLKLRQEQVVHRTGPKKCPFSLQVAPSNEVRTYSVGLVVVGGVESGESGFQSLSMEAQGLATGIPLSGICGYRHTQQRWRNLLRCTVNIFVQALVILRTTGQTGLA